MSLARIRMQLEKWKLSGEDELSIGVTPIGPYLFFWGFDWRQHADSIRGRCEPMLQSDFIQAGHVVAGGVLERKLA